MEAFFAIFDQQKERNSAVFISNVWSLKPWIRIRIHLNCWISMNPDPQHRVLVNAFSHFRRPDIPGGEDVG
jgi:hypothetical protein